MNKILLSSLLLTASLTTGCREQADTTSVSTSQKSKPAVAVVPLIDSSGNTLGWNLSEEITYTLCDRLDQHGRLSLALPQQIKAQSRRMKSKHNPFGEDISWVKNVFHEEDFVVFLEMIEHNESPVENLKQLAPETLPANLTIALRLRIIDVRGETPKITLQEILQDSHFVPKQFNRYNFHQASWNTEEFAISPVGIAHAQLIKELRGRIEDYILLSCR